MNVLGRAQSNIVTSAPFAAGYPQRERRLALEGVASMPTCETCGKVFSRNGNLNIHRRTVQCGSRPDRFWSKVDASGDCWVWTAGLNPAGYGKFNVSAVPRLAHRYAYESLVGPIPQGLSLDHLCRNRACVNPDHLEPVTHAENMRRSPFANITRRIRFCRRGHSLVERKSQWRCLTCRRDLYAARQAAQRGVAA